MNTLMKKNQLQRKTMSIYENMHKLINIDIRDPKTVYKGSQCWHQYTQKVSTSCRLQAAGCRPQAAGCKLQATGYRRGASGPLGVSGYKPGATGGRLQATGCKLQTTSIMCGVGPRIISVCWRAFRKRWFPIASVAEMIFQNMWDR